MTKILGIDYGRSKLGFAFAEGSIAAPLKVIRTTSPDEAVEQVIQVAAIENPEFLVVGISEGEMGEEQLAFAQRLREHGWKVENWDEGLSTYDAINLSIEAGVKQGKRRTMEDAMAAAVVLQSFLDSQ